MSRPRHAMSYAHEACDDDDHDDDGGVGDHRIAPDTSKRMQVTNDPVITKTKGLTLSTPGTMSLAQGIVHWKPPDCALERATWAMEHLEGIHGYGPDEGNQELRTALCEKIARENGLCEYDVHVTTGANQAFANLVLSMLDPDDTAVLFAPFYFNHMMAIQMTGGSDSVEVAPFKEETYHPDLDWLESRMQDTSRPTPKLVVLVNPNNPTGAVMGQEELERASNLCADAGAWLVVDNTYEHFTYDGKTHFCPRGKHVVHVFSFSKAFGMMGWRQGYIAFHPDAPGDLGQELLKVQDTVPICPTQISQQVSLGALEAGRPWVTGKIEGLLENRSIVLSALECLGKENIAPSEGAIYIWAKLPQGCNDDDVVVEWLVKKHKVCVIPGSSCGCPGHIRVAFANLQKEDCKIAASRLAQGLKELVSSGTQILHTS